LGNASHIHGVETRTELVSHAQELAARLDFRGMSFLNMAVAAAMSSANLPDKIDMVTALHACDTASDQAIDFALHKQAPFIVLVPCCQAEVAAVLRKNKGQELAKNILTELWRHSIHTREFGSHLTNVLRCLRLEAHGYQVTVTELVGWEHSMKNELIIARYKNLPRHRPAQRLQEILKALGLEEMQPRFAAP
ncbi:MAG: SAM-dependent methyltransferase, partial [Gallionellaceae bacterium]|nr:SAM-dependent methyltransferase [Gallionellaceae bacterium]